MNATTRPNSGIHGTVPGIFSNGTSGPTSGSGKLLTEVKNVRQISGEGKRRWFADAYFDLIVWYNSDEEITGFQLCYDKQFDERALTWNKVIGYTHERIDTGEDDLHMRKSSPVLVLDGIFDFSMIAEKFKSCASQIDSGLTDFIYNAILEYH
ncbi:hypothetical protein ACFL67_03550 [candidate division KSB1 bacterium]